MLNDLAGAAAVRLLVLFAAGCEAQLTSPSDDEECAPSEVAWSRFEENVQCSPTEPGEGILLIASETDWELRCTGTPPPEVDFDTHLLLAVHLSHEYSGCADRAKLVTAIDLEGCTMFISRSDTPDFDQKGACLAIVQPTDWILVEKPIPFDDIQVQ